MIERVRLDPEQVLKLASELQKLQASPGWKELEVCFRGWEAETLDKILNDETTDPMEAFAHLHDSRGFIAMIRQLRENLLGVQAMAERAASTNVDERESAYLNWWRET